MGIRMKPSASQYFFSLRCAEESVISTENISDHCNLHSFAAHSPISTSGAEGIVDSKNRDIVKRVSED